MIKIRQKLTTSSNAISPDFRNKFVGSFVAQLSVGCLGLLGIASFAMSLLKARLLPCISKMEYGKQELSFQL